MGQNGIDNQDTNPLGVNPILPPDGMIPLSNPTITPASSSTESTLSQSVSAASAASYDFSFPQLEMPMEDADISSFLNAQSQKEEQIARDLLDKWLDSLQERARRTLEELRSPQYQHWLMRHSAAFYAELERNQNRIDEEFKIHQSPEYLSWVGTLNPRDLDAQVSLETTAVALLGAIDAAGSYVERTRSGEINAVDALPLVAASIAIGVSNLGEVVTAKEVGKVADLNAAFFQQIWDQLNPVITQELRPDILGLIGAMAMVRLTALATMEVVAANPGGQPQSTKKFAEAYAKLVIQLVTGTELDKQCSDMLAGKSKSPGESGAILKIVFLSTALALLYKQEAGKITGEEFEAMLTGKIPLKEGDTKATLVSLLRGFLGQLSKATSENLLEGLFEYMNSDPKVDQKMTEASRLYTNLLQTMPNPRPLAG